MKHLLTFLIFSFTTFSAFSNEINLRKMLLERASASKAAADIAHANDVCKKIPFGPHTDCQALVVDNIRTTKVDVKYSQVKPAPIPETILAESFLFSNCSTSERKYQRVVALTFTEGEQVVTTDSVVTSNGGSVTLSVEGQQLGMTHSREVTFTEAKTHDFTKVVNETITVEESLKPMTVLLIKIEKRLSNAYLDFEGQIRANADVYSAACCGWNGSTVNLGTFSDLVGDYIFPLKGQIWNAKAERTVKSYSEIPVDKKNPLHCPPVELRASRAMLSTNQLDTGSSFLSEINFVKIGDKLAGAVPLNTLAGTQQTVPFVDGMAIRTANVVANVEVRAKSMGPGMCGVRFSTNSGGQTQFLAPPHMWSPWTNLSSHIGSVSMTLHDDVKCDTGIIAEVRYYK